MGENSADDEERRKLLERANTELALKLAALPQSEDEAFEHVKDGLLRALEASKLLSRRPSHGLTSDQWHTMRMLCEGLWDAFRRGDASAELASLRLPVRSWQSDRGGPPLAGGVERVQQGAAALARDLERAKSIGLEAAILESDGHVVAPGPVPTRAQVSTYLAIKLQRMNEALPEPLLAAPFAPGEKPADLIYSRMPLNGHGAQCDRTGSFRDTPFAEDPEKTVIAAFKAAGLAPQKADQLFKARLVQRNRDAQKRRRQSQAR